MDRLKLNMRQHRWLDVVKDNDYEILYHHGKANVVVDTLIRRANSTPIQDLCLRMAITSQLLGLIKEAHVEGLKRENWKEEMIRGQLPLFSRDTQGLLNQ